MPTLVRQRMRKLDELTINSLDGFFSLVIKSATEDTRLQILWYRGHASAAPNWKLIPSVHRHFDLLQESDMVTRFRLQAATRYEKCPRDDDFARWLALMRHFGLPTRLLDWTRSPLYALFFAVEDSNYDNQLGVLWQLRPTKMNKIMMGHETVLLLPHRSLATLLEPAFTGRQPGSSTAAAVMAPEVDLRMAVQQSMFTIHRDKNALEKSSQAAKFLRKFIIPAESKKKLRYELRAFGVRRSSLFPDLENLSRDLEETERDMSQ
jgi:hypothetical protein